MTDVRNPSRRVKFDEAGEGAYLLLRNGGCKVLQREIGVDWFQAIERACLFYNVEVMEQMLLVMVHGPDDKLKKIGLDDLSEDVLMQTVSDKLLDAFCLAIHGRDFKQQLEWAQEQSEEFQKRQQEKNPTTSPAASSDTSSEEPTGPASDQPSSMS